MKFYVENGTAFFVEHESLVYAPFEHGTINFDDSSIWAYIDYKELPLLNRVNRALDTKFVIHNLKLTNYQTDSYMENQIEILGVFNET